MLQNRCKFFYLVKFLVNLYLALSIKEIIQYFQLVQASFAWLLNIYIFQIQIYHWNHSSSLSPVICLQFFCYIKASGYSAL